MNDNNMEQLRNSKTSDSGGKLIFGNAELCSQLLRDYSDLDILKDVKAENIEDVTERFLPMFTEERNADVVKKVHLSDGEEMFVVSLIDHKSSVDYNVSMQLLRYMVYIWEDYEKQSEKEHKGISKTKGFKYPPILPIVYYEGPDGWNADKEFSDRIFLKTIFEDYIPHFSYKLIQLNDYSKEELIEREDELSVLMLINKLRKVEEFNKLNLPDEYLEKIAHNAPNDVLDIMARVVSVLLRRIQVPEDEIWQVTDKIKERKMGELFEHFEPYSVIETRKIAKAEGKKELLIENVCKKLKKGKSVEVISDELEEEVGRIRRICDVAVKYAPDYDAEKILAELSN